MNDPSVKGPEYPETSYVVWLSAIDLPTTMRVKSNPRLIALRWTWSGSVANPMQSSSCKKERRFHEHLILIHAMFDKRKHEISWLLTRFIMN